MSEASASSTTRSSGSASPLKAAAPLRLTLMTASDELATLLAARMHPAGVVVRASADGRSSGPAAAKPGAAGSKPSHAGTTTADAEADAVLLDIPHDSPAAMEYALGVLARLRDAPVPVLALTSRLPREKRIALYRAGVLAFLSPDEDPEELTARLTSLLTSKRTAANALKRLRDHTRHLDEQLRLAQRLQMDFLPRRMPTMRRARIAARLEAASWVAGDFYDVFRLDEQHVGFYVADAVGHGIPAALLTVFVKKSLQTKRIDGRDYELIPPEESLRLLNADLLSAELQETPFITMVYGVYNEVTRECRYARAGHPKPLILSPKGTLSTLEGEGPLLGIFGDAEFEPCRRTLEPGERFFLYTDGAERVTAGNNSDPDALMEVIRSAALLPVEAMLDAILDAVHAATGGDHLADDITLVAIELEAAAG